MKEGRWKDEKEEKGGWGRYKRKGKRRIERNREEEEKKNETRRKR